MSDRKITAGEAQLLLDGAPPGPWPIKSYTGEAELTAAAPDLARTVIEQAEEIADLDAQNERLSTDLFKVTRQRNQFREEARSPMFPPMPEPADQAEQIKRLQMAVNELSREMAHYRPHEVAWVELTHDNILTMEDMDGANEY